MIDILQAFAIAALGVLAFAAGLARYLFAPTRTAIRVLLFAAAALLLAPGPYVDVLGLRIPILDASGLLVFAVAATANARGRRV